MGPEIRKLDYYRTVVRDRPGEGYRLLSGLAAQGINLLAFSALPLGPSQTQLMLFPEDRLSFKAAAQKAGFELDGPHAAILVRGDDEIGAFAAIHHRLSAAKVNVFASSGMADRQGSYAYILYISPEQYDQAVQALDF